MQTLDSPSLDEAVGALTLRFTAEPGLYQLSVVADATHFDWDELYFDLHLFGNRGQRTGPWDFDLREGNRPLLPAYRVALNGRPIGIWFFQRVSLEDLEAKSFRGRCAFRLEASDLDVEQQVELCFTPVRPLPITWSSVQWETDPEDNLDETAAAQLMRSAASKRLPAADWNSAEYWGRGRELLGTTHALYAPRLARAFEWIKTKERLRYDDVPLLIAAYHLGGYPDGLSRALRVIDETVALPHWSNAQPDGYSHDGDIGAADTMFVLAWSLHALRDALGAERTARVRAKLQLQGKRFLQLALLNRDYWGGSVLQDHGWRSHFAFGAAVLHLVGELPEAESWLAYVLPRVDRALEAMPRDGVLPQSSYGDLHLYLDVVMHFRGALRALSGQDILDRAPFREIPNYVSTVLRESDHTMLLPDYNGGTVAPFIGGNAFFNALAARCSDGRAAYLQRALLETPEALSYRAPQLFSFHNSVLWGFLTYDPAAPALEQLSARPRLVHFPDSGLVHYSDADGELALALRCGPWLGRHADALLRGPCDAMAGTPGAGHFVLARGSTPVYLTPDAGYSLTSAICSCMLVDGRGQYGDVGYPMSIPSWQHRGEHVAGCEWDENTGEGRVCLELAPAYDEASGVLSYCREFLFSSERIVCRDTVRLDAPRRLSWLFQQHAGAADGQLPEGQLPEVAEASSPLTCSLCETPVVYSYSSHSNYARFAHTRFDTTEPVQSARVDFVLATTSVASASAEATSAEATSASLHREP